MGFYYTLVSGKLDYLCVLRFTVCDLAPSCGDNLNYNTLSFSSAIRRCFHLSQSCLSSTMDDKGLK